MSNLIIKLNGEIQSSNFHEWKDGLIEQIQSAQLALKTDNDFAAAELNIKILDNWYSMPKWMSILKG
ncbi:MAG TPA: hypothetical protein EYQ06_04275 [Flavobacteriales bacterium]|nr:hypothetical protein [Flavobacteriales bacterium]